MKALLQRNEEGLFVWEDRDGHKKWVWWCSVVFGTKSRKIPKKQLVEEEKDCCLISLTGGALLPGSTEP
ncbi:hypothetical protein AAC387_Pa05g0454 [Persea americana]